MKLTGEKLNEIKTRNRSRPPFPLSPQGVYGITTATVKVGYEYKDCDSVMWNIQTTKLSGHDMADTDFVDVPLADLTSDEYAAERAADIDPAAATPSLDVGPGLESVDRGTNTTHFSVVDPMGNAVAVTGGPSAWAQPAPAAICASRAARRASKSRSAW